MSTYYFIGTIVLYALIAVIVIVGFIGLGHAIIADRRAAREDAKSKDRYRRYVQQESRIDAQRAEYWKAEAESWERTLNLQVDMDRKIINGLEADLDEQYGFVQGLEMDLDEAKAHIQSLEARIRSFELDMAGESCLRAQAEARLQVTQNLLHSLQKDALQRERQRQQEAFQGILCDVCGLAQCGCLF